MEESFWTFDESSPHHGWEAWYNSWPTFSSRLDQAADQIVADIHQGLNGFRGPVILGGFSQGCGTALYIGMYKMPVAAVAGFSGVYLLPKQDPLYRPPLLWSHGDEDTVIPLDWMKKASAAFFAHGLPLETYVMRGVGHKLTSQAVKIAREFIIRHVTCFE